MSIAPCWCRPSHRLPTWIYWISLNMMGIKTHENPWYMSMSRKVEDHLLDTHGLCHTPWEEWCIFLPGSQTTWIIGIFRFLFAYMSAMRKPYEHLNMNNTVYYTYSAAKPGSQLELGTLPFWRYAGAAIQLKCQNKNDSSEHQQHELGPLKNP